MKTSMPSSRRKDRRRNSRLDVVLLHRDDGRRMSEDRHVAARRNGDAGRCVVVAHRTRCERSREKANADVDRLNRSDASESMCSSRRRYGRARSGESTPCERRERRSESRPGYDRPNSPLTCGRVISPVAFRKVAMYFRRCRLYIRSAWCTRGYANVLLLISTHAAGSGSNVVCRE